MAVIGMTPSSSVAASSDRACHRAWSASVSRSAAHSGGTVSSDADEHLSRRATPVPASDPSVTATSAIRAARASRVPLQHPATTRCPHDVGSGPSPMAVDGDGPTRSRLARQGGRAGMHAHRPSRRPAPIRRPAPSRRPMPSRDPPSRETHALRRAGDPPIRPAPSRRPMPSRRPARAVDPCRWPNVGVGQVGHPSTVIR